MWVIATAGRKGADLPGDRAPDLDLTAGDVRQDAAALRILAAQRVLAMFVDLGRPGLERDIARLQVRREILDVAAARQPDAGQIGPAVRRARRRRLKIRFAVG